MVESFCSVVNLIPDNLVQLAYLPRFSSYIMH